MVVMIDLPPFDMKPAIIRPERPGLSRSRLLLPEARTPLQAMLPGTFNPMLIAANTAAVATHETSIGNGTDASSHNLSATLTNAAYQGRWLLLAVFGAGGTNRTVSSLSVFGTAATYIGRCQATGGPGANPIELWAVQLDSGTSGTIAVAWSGQVVFCAVTVWSVKNLRSITPAQFSPSTASPASASLAVPLNGFAIAAAYSGGVSGVPSATWAGLSQSSGPVGLTSGAYVAATLNAPDGGTVAASCTFASTTSAGRCAWFAAFR